MAYLRIHCENCGGTWEIYNRDNWSEDSARQCPHCFSEIARDVWQRNVIPAFCEVDDANRELYKEHTGYRKPLFSFDVIADPLRTDRQASRNACPVYQELKDILNVLNENYFEDDSDPYDDEPADDDRPQRWKNCPNLD